jgi:hypothetical protein
MTEISLRKQETHGLFQKKSFGSHERKIRKKFWIQKVIFERKKKNKKNETV